MYKNNILTPIIFIVILILISLFLNKFKKKRLCENLDSPILRLYQMFYDIDFLFQKHKLTYFIDAGTLLGAVRHKGIIPWDDDGDICVFKQDEKKLLNLKKDLNNLGYDIVKYWAGYKIYSKNGQRIKIENSNWKWNDEKLDKEREDIKYTFPFIDVFLVNKINNIVHYDNTRVRKIWGKCFQKYKDLFPLRKYKFGKINLYGPNNPKSFLDNCYGNDWQTIKKDSYDHLNQKFKKAIPNKMNYEDYKPAEPLGPIVYRS